MKLKAYRSFLIVIISKLAAYFGVLWYIGKSNQVDYQSPRAASTVTCGAFVDRPIVDTPIATTFGGLKYCWHDRKKA
jgi:hypothetical protein